MVLISTVFTIFFVFRSTWVQTLSVRLVADYLSKELKTDIRIGGFDLSLTKGLVIEDISIRDRKKQAIFSAHKLSIQITRLSLRKKIMKIRQVYIDQGVFQLITYKGDSTLNLQFIVDYFASKDTSRVVDTTVATPWKLSASSVELVDTRFR